VCLACCVLQWLETTTRRGDPPLSKLGHQQARETGAFVESIFLDENILPDKIVWLSSPFLRCIQTSDTALNAFSTMDTDAVKILPEYSVFEMDGHGGKMHKSLPPIEERAHYYPRLDASHESLFVPALPEPREGLRDRCEKAMQYFNKKYLYSPGTAFVIITHAASCVALAKSASNMTLQEITPAAPCSIFQLTRTSQTDVWEMDPHDKPAGRNGYTS
jgi:broad specificity phosphatase PhoE